MTAKPTRKNFIPSEGTPLDEIGLQIRPYNALRRSGIATVEDLLQLTDDELLAIRNLGETSLEEIKEKIRLCNLDPSFDKQEFKKEEGHSEPIGEYNLWAYGVSIINLELPNLIENNLLRAGITDIFQLTRIIFEGTIYQLVGIGKSRERRIFESINRFELGWPCPQYHLMGSKIPVKNLNLTRYSYRWLQKTGIHCLGDLYSILSKKNEEELKSLGKKVSNEVKAKYFCYAANSSYPKPSEHKLEEILQCDVKPGKPISELFSDWISEMSDRQKEVIFFRFGINGKPKTLQETGDTLGITRERVRQIQAKAIRNLERLLSLQRHQELRKVCERIIEERLGFVSIKDVNDQASSELTEKGINPIGMFSLLFSCYKDVKWDRSREIWSHESIAQKVFQAQVSAVSVLEKNLASMKYETLVEKVCVEEKSGPDNSTSSKEFIERCIDSSNEIMIDDNNRVGLKKWENRRLDEMVLAMRILGEPVHYSVLADKTNDLLPPEQRATPRIIHAHISRLPDIFIRVGNGVFGLAEWGLHDDGNLANAAYRVLREVGTHLHIDVLTERVMETWRVNEYSVKAAIDLDARFEEIQLDIYILREHLDISIVTISTKTQSVEQQKLDDKNLLASDVLLQVIQDIGISSKTDIAESQCYKLGDGAIVYNAEKQTIEYAGKKVRIKAKTSALFEMLLENEGQVVSKHEIIRKVWRRGNRGDIGILQSHINMIRESIENDPSNPKRLCEIEDEGYILNLK